jgi:signal transduction histidine kinase
MDAVAVDSVVAIVMAAGAVAIELASGRAGPASLLSAVAVCATVAWRRREPAVSTLVAVAAITVYENTGGNPHVAIEPIAVMLNYYMLGRRSAELQRVWVEVPLLAAAVGAIAATPGTSTVPDVLSTWALFIILPFAAGRAIGSRGALTRELRANAERLEREQEERTRAAAADERNRIARELHDVVAHSVSVMVIQTAAARRVAAVDREAARDALRAVEGCGRDALIEMRRMVGVLRRGDVALSGVAAPGVSQLGELVARARAAGLPVELRIEGQLESLPPGQDLVAFRVVQEALTNAIKHAGPARAVVRVKFAAGVVELNISDNGRGPHPADDEEPSDRVRHGLVGMRERLMLYGGELETGRRRGGGFEVKATIPLEQAVPA